MTQSSVISDQQSSGHAWQLPSQPSIREVVTDRVRRAIVDQEIRPGTRLRQTQLADALGVSRMPVRDAIQELVAEGLLQPLPSGGVRVPSFDVDEISSALALRRPLEEEAVRALSARGADRDQLRRLLDVPSGLHFHRALVALADNRFLTSALIPVWAQAERLAHVLPEAGTCCPDSVDHRTIVHALADGDGAQAAQTLRRHLDAARAEVTGWMERHKNMAS